MIFLLAQIAKYHKNFNLGPHMQFIYKSIYQWVKGSLTDVPSQIAQLIPGILTKQIVRLIVHTLLPK